MTVYVVQIENWGWENEAVFLNIEDAQEYILNRYVENYPEDCEENEDGILVVPQDIINELNEYSYITDFAAIETWEVQ